MLRIFRESFSYFKFHIPFRENPGMDDRSTYAWSFAVTVETLITQCPPHRSRRAELPHRALQIYSLPYLSKTFFKSNLIISLFNYFRLN